MKVFISWSGIKSKAVGDLLDEWLQCVIQAIDPWISTKNIDRGALWFTEITTQLNDTSIGIICLTKENKNNPWILFEAGALAKGLNSSRICTLLVDLEPSDIQDPLAQFNHTIPNKGGIFNLVMTLNANLGEKALKEKVLSQVFETYWPLFETQLDEILKADPQEDQEEKRSEDDILRELLSLSRNMDRRIRNLEYKDNKKISTNGAKNISQAKKVAKMKDLVEMTLDKLVLGENKEDIIGFLKEKDGVTTEMAERIYNITYKEYYGDQNII